MFTLRFKWYKCEIVNMNTFLARANTIFAFTLTVLAALTFGCFLTTAFNDHTATVEIDSSTAMVYVEFQMFWLYMIFVHNIVS